MISLGCVGEREDSSRSAVESTGIVMRLSSRSATDTRSYRRENRRRTVRVDDKRSAGWRGARRADSAGGCVKIVVVAARRCALLAFRVRRTSLRAANGSPPPHTRVDPRNPRSDCSATGRQAWRSLFWGRHAHFTTTTRTSRTRQGRRRSDRPRAEDGRRGQTLPRRGLKIPLAGSARRGIPGFDGSGLGQRTIFAAS